MHILTSDNIPEVHDRVCRYQHIGACYLVEPMGGGFDEMLCCFCSIIRSWEPV